MLSPTTLLSKEEPRTSSFFNISHTIAIIHMITGNLRHIDRSTTINRDAFNIENTITEQQLLPTTSLAVGGDSDGKVVIGF